MAEERDLEDEQQFLDRAHSGLDEMRADANRMLQSVLDVGKGGTFQSRTERDIVVRTSLGRLAQLDIGDQALLFGRIDRVPEGPDVSGESYHIGRLAVSGVDHEPLVVDWRAPIAEPFYRATGLDPQGLARRRHLAVKGRTVTGLEDEYFATEQGAQQRNGHDSAHGARLDETLTLGGPGALLAALGEVRTGQMGDIIGTIQKEQDEIIRSPLGGVLVVQGGPGTGKTAVALHRAAYLLYTHRFPLERQGVLVIGPNPLFLRYIEQVLPSLGETGVTLSTVSGLVPEIRVRAVEAPEVARLKGDVRMSRVLTRAIRTRQRPLRDDVAIPFGASILRLRAEDTADVVAAARRRPGAHNTRRRFVEQQIVDRLIDQYRARRQTPVEPSESEPDLEVLEELEALEKEDTRELRRSLLKVPELTVALDRMWPRLAPHELLHDLFGARPLLRAAAQGLIKDEEIALLHRPRSSSLDEVAWTAADVALIDEVRVNLGPRRGRAARARVDNKDRVERARQDVGFWPTGLDPSPLPSAAAFNDNDDVRLYGHIVVDEVQDLSPMQLRMLARRSISGSMTVVGDIAQATGPWAPRNWTEVTEHLSPRREPRLVELTVSYRTPAEVVAVARRVLAVAAPDLQPPRPVRHSGNPPQFVQAAPSELFGAAALAARDALGAVRTGRVAVLAPEVLLAPLAQAFIDLGLDGVDPRDYDGPGLSAPLVLLPASEANGLEFDAVVVVEPALVASEGRSEPGGEAPEPTTRGLRTLYVSLTRPTQRLTVVHSLALPVALDPNPAAALI